MKLIDLMEDDSQETPESGRYDPQEDNLRKASLEQTRRPRLTLRHINKLKKMRAAKEFENVKQQKVVARMYNEPAEE